MDELVKKLQVKEGGKFSLKDHQTGPIGSITKEDVLKLVDKDKEDMSSLQDVLYAGNKYSILIIFQAMDAAGKDSAVKHVMGGVNPQGTQVFSFKQPSKEEYEHDFLWRHYKALPESGRIGIHNRSHYENVLVCKVHPEYIMAENIPGYDSVKKVDDKFWQGRYESIRNFEKHLAANGTVILKFFLNVSKDVQKERFLERIDDASKNWKFSSGDITERGYWKDYMKAYEQAINETAKEHSPWYVIPADKKWFARYAISKIIIETMKGLNLKYPEVSDEEKARLATCKESLMSEKKGS